MLASQLKSIVVVFVVSPLLGFAQTALVAKWTVKHLFLQKVFIENNEGQFDGKTNNKEDKIYFSTEQAGVSIFFTSTGVVYRHDVAPKLTEEQREKKEHGKDDSLPETKNYFFSEKWEGANKDFQVVAEDEVSFYYCYPVSNKHTTIAHAFKKLLYKNIYPGIDVEYSFPQDTCGIEYSVIVHPSADLSQVKLAYTDAQAITQNTNGDIVIQSSFGKFIDHAPFKIFYAEDSSFTTSQFVLKDNEVSFNIDNYDRSKTLVIDPWVTNPSFLKYDRAFDVNYDLQGNVYAYGGGNFFIGSYQLVKLDNAGNILWYYNVSPIPLSGDPCYDAFTVNKQNGIIYVAGGSATTSIFEVTQAGILLNTFTFGATMNEVWRMEYDACIDKLVIAGGGTAAENQAAVLDPNFSASNTANVLGASLPFHDMCLFTLDNFSGYCYMAAAERSGDSSITNILVKCPVPNLSPTIFEVPDGYNFTELYSVAYVQYANAMNGMTASLNWLYLYDGATLKRFDKNTGTLTKSATVSNTPCNWGGLDVDDCENLYVGNNNEIDIYDSALNETYSMAMPSASYSIYDLRLGVNNLLYACGTGFVSAFQVSVPSVQLSITGNSACSGCNGTAYVTLNSCYGNGASYLWSNGETDQIATGLCAGTYSVTATYNCVPYTDSVTILASSNPDVQIPTSQINQINCIGANNGSATAVASGGTPPYTYTWLPTGETGATLDNLGAGIYSVIVTDANGCSALTSVNMNAKDYQLFVPEAFSPNNDGQNDYLYVRSNCIKSMDFMIFDRWGNKVFETTDQSIPWNGRYKGEAMNTGTYIYYLSATMYDGKTVEQKGNVTLVR